MRRPSRRQAAKAELGQHAESLVADRLRAEGFEVVARNARVGRLEIDVIASRGSLLVFCEVRARRGDAWVAPHHTIDAAKARRVRSAAAAWLRQHPSPQARELRLDVASVVFDDDEGARIDYFESAL